VLTGLGGAFGLYGRNPTGHYKASGRLWTFALDADVEFEPIRGIDRPALTRIEHDATPEQLARGADLYGQRCSMCHGVAAASGGTVADLRYALPTTYAIFDQIVRDGAYANLGMPVFDWFSDADLEDLRAYLLAQRDALLDQPRRPSSGSSAARE
jgi:quinohemoprotein ethanol dehydrogenase